MKRHQRSLRARLSMWLAVQTFFVLGVVCAVIYVATNLNLSYRQDALLGQRIEVIRHLIEEHAQTSERDMGVLRHKLDDFFRGYSDIRLTLTLDRVERYGRFDDDGDPTRSIVFALPPLSPGSQPLDALLELDLSADIALRRTLAWALSAIVVCGAVIVSLLSAWTVRRALAPIDALSAEAATVSPDKMGQRLDEAQPTELRPLVRQFNAVLGRLEHAYVQLEGFNADVAHELRTPLATLIGQTELALTRDYSADAIRDTLGSNLEELHRLSQIVADMLFLSRAERGATARRNHVQSLAAMATDVANYHEAEAEDSGVSIEIQGDAAAAIDRSLIQRAISNLVSNAIRFSPTQSQIVIYISRLQRGDICIDVGNRGPQIAEHALPRIFQRFYRADAARSGDSEHHGLGLAIVAAIARMHEGHAHARSDASYTWVGLSFPGKAREAFSSRATGQTEANIDDV